MSNINNFYLNRKLNEREVWITAKNNNNEFITNKLSSDIFNNSTNLKLINGICFSPNNTVSVLDEITANNNIEYSSNDLISMKVHSLFMILLNNINVVGFCYNAPYIYNQGLKYLLQLNKIPFTCDEKIKFSKDNNDNINNYHNIDFVINNTHAFYINYLRDNSNLPLDSKLNEANALIKLNSYTKLHNLESFSCVDIYDYNNKCVVVFRNGLKKYLSIELTPKLNYINIDNNVKNIIHVCRDIAFQAMSELGFVYSADHYQQYILDTLKKSNNNIPIQILNKYPVLFNDNNINKIELGNIEIPIIINESLILIILAKKQITMKNLLYLKHLCFTTGLPGIIINFVSNAGNGIQLIDCNENTLIITSPYLENCKNEYTNTPYINPKSFKRNKKFKSKRKNE